MATTANVQVGDIGTLYKAKIQDEGAAFPDLATASVAQIVFKTPGAGVTVRTGTVTTDGTDYYIEYRVLGTAPDLLLHSKPGKNCSWQGYVEFGDGQRYHTSIELYEIKKNLN